MVSKSIIFLVKSFFVNFYRHLAIFFWSHCTEYKSVLLLLHLYKVCQSSILSLFFIWPLPASFFFIFNNWQYAYSVNNFVNDLNRTADLWNRKQQLCQLCHNHCHPFLWQKAMYYGSLERGIQRERDCRHLKIVF